jgi:hypothetical protein
MSKCDLIHSLMKLFSSSIECSRSAKIEEWTRWVKAPFWGSGRKARRVECDDKCGRRGQYHLHRLIERHSINAKLFERSDEITAHCPRHSSAAKRENDTTEQRTRSIAWSGPIPIILQRFNAPERMGSSPAIASDQSATRPEEVFPAPGASSHSLRLPEFRRPGR